MRMPRPIRNVGIPVTSANWTMSLVVRTSMTSGAPPDDTMLPRTSNGAYRQQADPTSCTKNSRTGSGAMATSVSTRMVTNPKTCVNPLSQPNIADETSTSSSAMTHASGRQCTLT